MNGELSPDDGLIRLINRINSSPNIVGVINNGTTVDADWLPFFKRIWKGYSRKKFTRWRAFYGEIDRLNKEYYEVPGHHPHRKTEMQVISDMQRILPTSFGEHVLPAQVVKRFTSMSGPAEKNISAFHCVFLNTGKDAMTQPKHWGNYAKKVVYGKRLSYDCEGLSDSDLEYLRPILDKGGRDTLYIFLHCPIINSRKSSPGRSYQLNTKDFIASTAKNGLGHDVILNNGGRLLEMLVGYPRNIVIITSHIDHSKYYLIDKKTLIAKEVTIEEFNEELRNTIFLKHLNTPCLGALHKSGNCSGYLSIGHDRVKEVELYLSAPAVHIDDDMNQVVKDTGKLMSCLEEHRNIFVRFERIVMNERKIFEDIKDELEKMEPLFDGKGRQLGTIITSLDRKIKYSLQEYSGSHEKELELLKKSLAKVHKEYDIYEGIIPKVQEVFSQLSIGHSDRFEGVSSVFFEWYKSSIQGVRSLSHKILYKENLFDNIEKKVIHEIHRIIKDTRMRKNARYRRLEKVKKEIGNVSGEIDSYFLNIPVEHDEKKSLTLYSVSAEARKAVIFLDTVLRILEDFTDVFAEQSGQGHKQDETVHPEKPEAQED